MQNLLSRAWKMTAMAMIALPAALMGATAEGGEARLVLPDLSQSTFFNGAVGGRTLLLFGMIIVALGLVFGAVLARQLKALPVHKSMLEVSELIYRTCKTYLITQGKFLAVLEAFIGVIIIAYFGFLEHMPAGRVIIILGFSLIGILGSCGVAWFGIRVNTYANSRTAFARPTGQSVSLP